MNILAIVSSSSFWLAELTHPYWHFIERGHKVAIASPTGGSVRYDDSSDPYSKGSSEADDLVSKGFLSDKALVEQLQTTIALKDVNPEDYDAVHVAGGGGACVDLYPNDDVARILEHFYAAGKLVGTICHGSVVLANNPERVRGLRATGFSRAEDAQLEAQIGANFLPHFPQPVMEAAGIKFSHVEPWQPYVVVQGKLVTGQNQMSASEYALAYLHVLTGSSPVKVY